MLDVAFLAVFATMMYATGVHFSDDKFLGGLFMAIACLSFAFLGAKIV